MSSQALQTKRNLLAGLLPGLAISLFLLAVVGFILNRIISIDGGSFEIFSSLTDRDWDLLDFTVYQAVLSVVLSSTLGVLVAWCLYHQRRFPGRALLVAAFSSALVLPTLVVALGLVTVLGRNGWLNYVLESFFGVSISGSIYGLTGILIGHVYLNASFATRALLNRFEAIPEEKRRLAQSLNLSVLQRFIFVEWPAIKTTIPGVSAIIFLLCFTSFAIVLILGGSPKNNTLEVAIYEAIKLDFDIPHALDLALFQLMICAGLVMTASGYRTASASIAEPSQISHHWPESTLPNMFQVCVVAFAGLCFGMPLIAIVFDGMKAEFFRLFSEKSFQQAFWTSIVIATASCIITVVLGLAMGIAKRNFTLKTRFGESSSSYIFSRIISFSATLYLAFPALVLALGFFLIARQLPGSLNAWAIVAVLFANVLLALPFSLAILFPALEKTAKKHDRLVFSLNLTPWARWRFCEWPLLKRDIAYVAAIAFCFSYGDLGVIALFGSQDFATLPWYLYQKMGSYRTDDAAGIALIMLTITLFVFLVLPRLVDDANENEGLVDVGA